MEGSEDGKEVGPGLFTRLVELPSKQRRWKEDVCDGEWKGAS
jgi:hypothetical protein